MLRAGSCGSAACTCAHLCLFLYLLSIPGAAAGAQLQAQAAKLLAWHSTGSLAEPGIELQSAVFQALAFSHRPIPPLHSLTSWQTAASCVQGQLLLQRCLTSILQMFEVPFPPCLCELQQSASGISPMQRGGGKTVALTVFFP